MAKPFYRVCLRAALQNPRHVHRTENACLAAANSCCRQTVSNPHTIPKSSKQHQQVRSFASSPRLSAKEKRRSNEELSVDSSERRLVQDSTFDTVSEADLGSLAYMELEQHRELRDMSRLAAWDMPLLGELAVPWSPPNRASAPLRWRYTTYLGEAHPASQKVVVEFSVDQLDGLKRPHKLKLMKLAGPRFNPSTRVIKMSCDSFETQAQNKRFLANTIDKLLAEAQNEEGDQFDDVPLDTRHHKTKRRLKFPMHWAMTEERKAELQQLRKSELLVEEKEKDEKQLLIGAAVIEAARQAPSTQLLEPVMQRAQRRSR